MLLRDVHHAPHVTHVEIDGSRAEKQSRHLVFDFVLDTLVDVHDFVLLVREGCPLASEIVDMHPYKSKSSHMRLPLARKYASQDRMMPMTQPFELESALIQRVGPKDAPQIPEPEPEEFMGDLDAVERLKVYLRPYRPSKCRTDGKKFSCYLRGMVCPNKGAEHKSNGTSFHVYFGRVTEGEFTCLDEECNKVKWDCHLDLDAICFGSQADMLALKHLNRVLS